MQPVIVPIRPHIEPFAVRLSRLARRVLTGKSPSRQQLWRIQLQLDSLLRDLQNSINEIKDKGRREVAARREDLTSLRQLRADALRLGDSIAWICFEYNEQKIFPLSNNDGHDILPERDTGFMGTISAAIDLANQGWGFPILNDITDCLRIGDISFVRSGQPVVTVEVKTRVKDPDQSDGEEKKKILDISVIVGGDNIPDLVSPAELRDWPMRIRSNGEPLSRIDRQIVRIDKARAIQNASHGTLFTDATNNSNIFIAIENSQPTYWNELRKIISRARRTGYASISLDEGLFCVVFYEKDGLTDDCFNQTEYLDDIRALEADCREPKKYLRFDKVPIPEHQAPQLFLPFYLYPIPFTAKLDLLYSRLLIVRVTDMSKIVDEAEEAGLQVAPKKKMQTNLTVTAPVTDKNSGETYDLRMSGVPELALRSTIYEFRSSNSFTERLLEHRNQIARARSTGAESPSS
jgi:hypothetical protein